MHTHTQAGHCGLLVVNGVTLFFWYDSPVSAVLFMHWLTDTVIVKCYFHLYLTSRESTVQVKEYNYYSCLYSKA